MYILVNNCSRIITICPSSYSDDVFGDVIAWTLKQQGHERQQAKSSRVGDSADRFANISATYRRSLLEWFGWAGISLAIDRAGIGTGIGHFVGGG